MRADELPKPESGRPQARMTASSLKRSHEREYLVPTFGQLRYRAAYLLQSERVSPALMHTAYHNLHEELARKVF